MCSIEIKETKSMTNLKGFSHGILALKIWNTTCLDECVVL